MSRRFHLPGRKEHPRLLRKNLICKLTRRVQEEMLVWACIAPHGGELIPELANGTYERMEKTRAAMRTLGEQCRAAVPDTIVVFTPHGLAIKGYITVSVTRHASGSVDGDDGRRVSSTFRVDRDLADEICLRSVSYEVPVVQAAYDKAGNPAESLNLDWGALVPLWFMGASWPKPPQVVVICPDRSLPRKTLVDFGRAVAEAGEESEKRIAVICSADQGHGHSADGPYGFAEQSAPYDEAYCRAVADGDIARMLDWEEEWIETALPDSFWQTIMLQGALQHVPMSPELLSYEAPTYFGMACAAYSR